MRPKDWQGMSHKLAWGALIALSIWPCVVAAIWLGAISALTGCGRVDEEP